MIKLVKKIFGDSNQRQLNRLQKIVDEIDALEETYESYSDAQLQDMTTQFKERYHNGETLDDLLVEAYAVVREASKRVLNMRPFPVQLIGATDRKSTRLNSSHVAISYAVFCSKKKSMRGTSRIALMMQ